MPVFAARMLVDRSAVTVPSDRRVRTFTFRLAALSYENSSVLRWPVVTIAVWAGTGLPTLSTQSPKSSRTS